MFITHFNFFTQNTMNSSAILFLQFTFFQFLNYFLNKFLYQMLKLILTVRNFNLKHFIINRVIYQNKPSLTKFTDVRSYLFHELMANINFLTHFFSCKRNRCWKSRIIFFSYFFLINFTKIVRL